MIASGMRRAVRLARTARRAYELRLRTPPQLTAGHATDRPPMVYYLAPDQAAPSGGTRTIYRHVDLLNQAGIDATVLHKREGFRCSWFPNSTRVMAASQVTLGPSDILVVPEWYGVGLARLPAPTRKTIFNQGPYHTFDHVPYDRTGPGYPYTPVPNLVGILTVSEDAASLLRCTFPTIPVHQVRAVVDARFRPPESRAGRRIAFMPRRRPEEREHLLHILRSRDSLAGWELIPIDGRTEQETAEMMRGCAIFLSFSEREGFGLPPAEAMASGCYVVGFTGLGGREYFDPSYSSPVPEGDLRAYAHAVEDAVRRYDAAPTSFADLGRTASDRIRGHYHELGLQQDLVAYYRPLLAAPEPTPLPAPTDPPR